MKLNELKIFGKVFVEIFEIFSYQCQVPIIVHADCAKWKRHFYNIPSRIGTFENKFYGSFQTNQNS